MLALLLALLVGMTRADTDWVVTDGVDPDGSGTRPAQRFGNSLTSIGAGKMILFGGFSAASGWGSCKHTGHAANQPFKQSTSGP